MDCVFCGIVNGSEPASVVYTDAHTIAFLDTHPITEGHTLLIPRRHFGTVDDCPDVILQQLAVALKRVNRLLAGSVRCEGVLNEVMNGAAAGQEVFHLHLHVIPRYAGDGFGWTYPHDHGAAAPGRDVLDALAQRIRSRKAG